MPPSSELHIIAPGICGPLADTEPLLSSLVIERWIKLLSKSQSFASRGDTFELVAALSALEFTNDFPSAALTLLANDSYDASRFYMHADPVHLQADIDSALLTPGADLNISKAEADAFCQTLNQHFDQDGLTFQVLNNHSWFVSSKHEIKVNTTPLVDATGRNINFLLPAGENSVRWQQILTEAQMLLHGHECNETRENSGRASVNSLWFHGSGQPTEKRVDSDNTELNNLCSDHHVLKGFASHVQCDYLKVPDSVNVYADFLLSCKSGTNNVLHFSELEQLTNYTDVKPWLGQLEDVLNNWIYPLLSFANKNNIRLTLYPCTEKKYQFSKYDGLKFWRNDPLKKHVKRY